MSFGGTNSIAFEQAINYSYGNGSILIAAAGNSGLNSKIYPCGYENVICVAALDQSNNGASYSNYGDWVKIAAAGTNVYSTYFDDTYNSLTGTSMSTPMVSGAIGLIKSLFDKNGTEIINKLINTGSEVNFTNVMINRINLDSAILSFDDILPEVNLEKPEDNHINLTLNQTFKCNGTDWQLQNVSLEIWNSTNDLFYNETKNINGKVDETEFNVVLEYDNYEWNCLYNDVRSNNAYASFNFSLVIGNIDNKLILPKNNSYGNTLMQSFNCSAQTEPSKELTNVSFSLWNSSELIYKINKNISGLTDETNFNYNFSEEGMYSWNCLAFNNNSEFSMGSSNFTYIYDITNPLVSLLDPINTSSYSSDLQLINFELLTHVLSG